MSIVFIVLMALALAGAFVLVVLNRESAAVVNAAVPVAFGALSALGLVFAFTRPEPISKVSPSCSSWNAEPAAGINCAPAVSRYEPRPGRPHEADRRETFAPPEGKQSFDFIVPLYHEFLSMVGLGRGD